MVSYHRGSLDLEQLVRINYLCFVLLKECSLDQLELVYDFCCFLAVRLVDLILK